MSFFRSGGSEKVVTVSVQDEMEEEDEILVVSSEPKSGLIIPNSSPERQRETETDRSVQFCVINE